MKIHLVGADLLHTDGQIYAYRDRHDEANNRFFAVLRRCL